MWNQPNHSTWDCFCNIGFHNLTLHRLDVNVKLPLSQEEVLSDSFAFLLGSGASSRPLGLTLLCLEERCRNSCVNFSSPAALATVVVPVSATRRNVLHSSSLTAEDNPTWLLLCLCPLGLLARAHLAAVCLSYQSGYLTSPASPQD